MAWPEDLPANGPLCRGGEGERDFGTRTSQRLGDSVAAQLQQQLLLLLAGTKTCPKANGCWLLPSSHFPSSTNEGTRVFFLFFLPSG